MSLHKGEPVIVLDGPDHDPLIGVLADKARYTAYDGTKYWRVRQIHEDGKTFGRVWKQDRPISVRLRTNEDINSLRRKVIKVFKAFEEANRSQI